MGRLDSIVVMGELCEAGGQNNWPGRTVLAGLAASSVARPPPPPPPSSGPAQSDVLANGNELSRLLSLACFCWPTGGLLAHNGA